MNFSVIDKKNLNKKIFIAFLLFLFILSLASAAYGAQYPSHTPSFYVNDFANVLDSSTEQQIIETASQLDRKTGAQVVVVTLPELGDQPLEEYATGLFREWGIGSAKNNNGVLILLDVGGRQSRIEVGYGLEGILPDGKTGRIQDNRMVPYFKEGDYNQGILLGFDAIVGEVYSEYGIEYEGLAGYKDYGHDGWYFEKEIRVPGPFIFIGIIVIVILLILDNRLTGGMFLRFLLVMLIRG